MVLARMWSIGRKVVGGLLIAVGVVGLVLPGIQGIACIVAGALVWGVTLSQMSRYLHRVEWRFPRAKRLIVPLRDWVDRRDKSRPLHAESKPG